VDIIVDDWSQIKYWFMPMTVLGFGTMAFTARLTRSAMLEVMRQDYVRTARAKGLAERVVIFIHMLKNALIPVITILGPALAGLVTGSFIIETMFSFPGMGRAYVQAIGQRDYSMIMGTTVVYALLVAVANLSVDIIYVFIDPRIRLEE
jgi:oligopeptide transport system permease protein